MCDTVTKNEKRKTIHHALLCTSRPPYVARHTYAYACLGRVSYVRACDVDREGAYTRVVPYGRTERTAIEETKKMMMMMMMMTAKVHSS